MRDTACVCNMNDERVVAGPPFGGKNLGNSLRVSGISAQAVDGFSRQAHKVTRNNGSCSGRNGFRGCPIKDHIQAQCGRGAIPSNFAAWRAVLCTSGSLEPVMFKCPILRPGRASDLP